MGSGNEEGVLAQHGKAKIWLWGSTEAVFPTWDIVPEGQLAVTSSLEEDDHLKLQGEHKQQAGHPAEEQGWITALCTAPPQPQPAGWQMWVQEHPSVTAPLQCNSGPPMSAHSGFAAANLLTPVTSNEIWWSQWNLFCFPWLADQCF